MSADSEACDADAAGVLVDAVDCVVVDARALEAAAGYFQLDLDDELAGLAQDGADLGPAGEIRSAVAAGLEGVAVALWGTSARLPIRRLVDFIGKSPGG